MTTVSPTTQAERRQFNPISPGPYRSAFSVITSATDRQPLWPRPVNNQSARQKNPSLTYVLGAASQPPQISSHNYLAIVCAAYSSSSSRKAEDQEMLLQRQPASLTTLQQASDGWLKAVDGRASNCSLRDAAILSWSAAAKWMPNNLCPWFCFSAPVHETNCATYLLGLIATICQRSS